MQPETTHIDEYIVLNVQFIKGTADMKEVLIELTANRTNKYRELKIQVENHD